MGNNKKISEYEIVEIQEELKDLEENDIEAVINFAGYKAVGESVKELICLFYYLAF